jgi:hypothetical protein
MPDLTALLPGSPDAYPQARGPRAGPCPRRAHERTRLSGGELPGRPHPGPGHPGRLDAGAAVTQQPARSPAASRSISSSTRATSARRFSRASWTRPAAYVGLREPLPLRTLADAHDALGSAESLLAEPQFDSLLDMFLRLWGRGYASTRAVVVKATSSAGRLAGRSWRPRRHPAGSICTCARSPTSRRSSAARTRRLTSAVTGPAACGACSRGASLRWRRSTRSRPASSRRSAGWSRALRARTPKRRASACCLDFENSLGRRRPALRWSRALGGQFGPGAPTKPC